MSVLQKIRRFLGRSTYPHSIRVDEVNGFYFVPATCDEARKEIERLLEQRDMACAMIAELMGCDELVLRVLLDISSLEGTISAAQLSRG